MHIHGAQYRRTSANPLTKTKLENGRGTGTWMIADDRIAGKETEKGKILYKPNHLSQRFQKISKGERKRKGGGVNPGKNTIYVKGRLLIGRAHGLWIYNPMPSTQRGSL